MTISFPDDLHERLTRVSRRLKKPMAQIIKEAVREKVGSLENPLEERDRQRLRDKILRREAKGMRGIGESPLAPGRKNVEEREERDPLDEIYQEHARRILEVLDDPGERRIRLAEAIHAAKKRAPLTHPSEAVIVARIEAAVVEMRSREASPREPQIARLERAIDDLTGKVLDANRVETFGDAPNLNDPEETT